ncbi:aquaporin [Trichodelitschia bisporula]|uniref:Aquaporin n=1 Tax=Trichodelitschia bisporula TaxID=703511 RepID=A0A6G1HNM5_9PEZI|nr:aquaporin [Trichodelitschia bisporula]
MPQVHLFLFILHVSHWDEAVRRGIRCGVSLRSFVQSFDVKSAAGDVPVAVPEVFVFEFCIRPRIMASNQQVNVDQTGPRLADVKTESLASSGQFDRTSSGLRNTRSALGLNPLAPIDEEHDIAPHQDLLWSRIRLALREPFAEFLGTFILVLFGNGSVAQVVLSAGQKSAPGMNGFGDYQSINWGWGLGVMLGVYVAGDSGAYLNPAITFTNCLFRGLPWRRFPIYLIAQFLGGFVAAGVVYANYINAINTFEGGPGIRTVPPAANATAQIFCTYPQAFLTKASQFFSEFIASAILMLVIFALKDDTNNGVSRGGGNWFPLGLFFLIFGLGACFGWETGYAINLARDFGPRLMSYILGYGPKVWTAGDYYFWIPMFAPFCGCMFGAFLYDFFIYTGQSPVNTPWLGLKALVRPDLAWKVHRKHQAQLKAQEAV